MAYQILYPENICKNHIKLFLQLSNGVDDILKGQNISCRKLKFQYQHLEDMSINELIFFLTKYPLLLKSLIIFDNKHMLLGYHEEEIRIFLNRSYRRIYRENKD